MSVCHRKLLKRDTKKKNEIAKLNQISRRPTETNVFPSGNVAVAIPTAKRQKGKPIEMILTNLTDGENSDRNLKLGFTYLLIA